MKDLYFRFKQAIIILFCVLSFNQIFAQVPDGFSYQSVLRDNQGKLIAEKSVSLRISILSGSDTGDPVYIETHSANTSSSGLISLIIGDGTVVSGIFSDIKWNKNSYYVKVEVDPDAGSNYTIVGTNQILAVPYALYAGNVNNSDTSSTNELQILSISNDTIYLTNGSFVKLPYTAGTGLTLNGTEFVNASPNTDEQTLELSGNDLSISNGNTVTLPAGGGIDDDADSTNELQTLYLENDSIKLTNAVGGVPSMGVNFSVGYGLKLTGTYPNLTISLVENLFWTIGSDWVDTRDGHSYPTIQIGSQIWTAKNMNYGSQSDSSWYYNDDSTFYAETFGLLYDWDAAQNICPDGWHLPTDNEWKTLEKELGMTQVQADSIGLRGTDEGDQLKDGGTSGFKALIGGYRKDSGFFNDMSVSTGWWAADETSVTRGVRRVILDSSSQISNDDNDKDYAYYVRCIKD